MDRPRAAGIEHGAGDMGHRALGQFELAAAGGEGEVAPGLAHETGVIFQGRAFQPHFSGVVRITAVDIEQGDGHGASAEQGGEQ
jgi:hypothetical protein